jgi:hypothetical protein
MALEEACFLLQLQFVHTDHWWNSSNTRALQFNQRRPGNQTIQALQIYRIIPIA